MDASQHEKVAEFLKAASAKASKGVVELLFRGETRAHLGKRLCGDTSAPLSKVATGLFYFGEKGKHFWKEDVRRSQEEGRKEWNAVVRTIDDLSVESFNGLLRHLAKILKLELPAVRDFRAKNDKLCKIIQSESRREDLTGRFGRLSPAKKRSVRDCFIYVVHSFSRRNLKTYTPFVSTTPDFERAKYFAKQGAERDANPCVICLFLRAGQVDGFLRSTGLAKASSMLSGLGLPPINGLFFEENEVAFFGAVFPQLMFALVDLDSKAALWNPALFDVALDAGADVWKKGFPIDQKDFERFMLEQTGYASGIERNAHGDREIYPR